PHGAALLSDISRLFPSCTRQVVAMSWRLAHQGQWRIAAIAMALLVVGAQFSPAPLAVRAAMQSAPLTEDEQNSPPSEEERNEAQTLAEHSSWRGTISRDLKPAGRLPA